MEAQLGGPVGARCPCRALTNAQEQISLQTSAIIILYPWAKAAKRNIFLLVGHPSPNWW